MPPSRAALLIASESFEDTSFQGLRSVQIDSRGLQDVLIDPNVGGFSDVRMLVNEPAHVIREEIESFLRGSARHELALIYFSGHGLKDDSGELYFVARDTKRQLLQASGVAASFLYRQAEASPSAATFMILDCCFSGAFARGFVRRSGGDTMLDDLDPGRGLVVLTATNAIEYAFEGDHSTDLEPAPSIFTGAVIEGLRTGLADIDRDGMVSAEDLHLYVRDRVRASGAKQTPKLFSFVDGRVLLARNPFHRQAMRSGGTTRSVGTTAMAALVIGLSRALGAVDLPLRWAELTDVLGRYATGSSRTSLLDILNAVSRLPGSEGLISAGHDIFEAVQDLNSSGEFVRAVEILADAVVRFLTDNGLNSAAQNVGKGLVEIVSAVTASAADETVDDGIDVLRRDLKVIGDRLRELAVAHSGRAYPADRTGPDGAPELRPSMRSLTAVLRRLRYALRDILDNPTPPLAFLEYAATALDQVKADPARPPRELVSQIYLLGGALLAMANAMQTGPVNLVVEGVSRYANLQRAQTVDQDSNTFAAVVPVRISELATFVEDELLYFLTELSDPENQPVASDERTLTWKELDLKDGVVALVSVCVEVADWIRAGLVSQPPEDKPTRGRTSARTGPRPRARPR